MAPNEPSGSARQSNLARGIMLSESNDPLPYSFPHTLLRTYRVPATRQLFSQRPALPCSTKFLSQLIFRGMVVLIISMCCPAQHAL
jgi:hypothetical protein